MIADKALIIKAAELGLLRSIESFLLVPLKPGKLKTRFVFVQLIVDAELRKIREHDQYFFPHNKAEITVYLNTLSDALYWKGGETHIGTVIAFCLAFLERSKTVYDKKLTVYLTEMLDYYERADEVTYKDIFNGEEFDRNWKMIEEMMNDSRLDV